MSLGNEPRKGIGPPPPDRLKEPEKKKTLDLPDWMEEYLSALVIGVCIFFFAMFSLWQFTRVEPPNPVDPTTLARVAVLGPPRKIYEEGSATKVASVIASVRNLGPAEAVGMSVNADVFGVAIRLDGPGTMRPGETYEYEGTVGQHMSSSDQIRVSVRCGNCIQ
jgi:hypothetical protein